MLNKLIYVGLAILDISKICVYDFHYNYILPKFSVDNAKLLYTDNDSLTYEFKHEEIYEMIKRDYHKFDTDDFPQPNAYGIEKNNKKKPGIMKLEHPKDKVMHFCGLKSKMYTVKYTSKESMNKAKGVKKAQLKM